MPAPLLALCLLLSLLASPTLQADAQIRVDTRDQPTEVIALEARVRYAGTNQVRDYDISPAQHVQLTVGDRVQVSLVGTAIVDGRGVEVDIPADFEIASGDWRIDVAPAGRHAVTVAAVQPNEVHRGGNPDSRSSLRYEVQGNYDMKPALREGRVTFDIAPRPGSTPAPSQPSPSEPADERWEMAEEIASDLAYIRLDERDRTVDDYWVERIYLDGYAGVRALAQAQAAEATRTGELRGRAGEEVVAHLYRHLLGREGSTVELRAADPTGFDSNVRRLRSDGYEALVRTFVDSQEFRSQHLVDRLERLSRTYRDPRFREPADRRGVLPRRP